MDKTTNVPAGKWWQAGLLAALMAAGTATAGAQTTLYSTSFEAPTFTAGSSVVGTDGWLVGSSTGGNNAVTTTRANDGTQSLGFNPASGATFGSVIHPLGAFGANAVTLTVDFYVPAGNAATRLDEISFSTGTTLSSTVLGVSIAGSGAIRAGKTYTVIDGGSATVTAAAGTFADRWLTATLTFDPQSAAGAVTLSGFGGTTPSYTFSFTGVTTPVNAHLATDYTTSGTGAAYYDRFAVTAVPEPSAFAAAALGAGLLGVLARRRRLAA